MEARRKVRGGDEEFEEEGDKELEGRVTVYEKNYCT